MDDTSSLLDCHHGSSRRSLADTSVTSTADLSVFSAATRSHAHENSLDSHSNMSDGSTGATSFDGGATGSIQRVPSTHSTPRATPGPSYAPSPDILRIYVPYTSPLDNNITPTASPQNGDIIITRSPPKTLNTTDDNRIRIRIDTTQDDLQTPLVEHNQIKHFRIDSPEIDLK